MAHFAFVFPGQGSQFVGMGALLADAYPSAAAAFAAADAALGEHLAGLIREGPAAQLDQTENAQPALLATSMALLAALRDHVDAEGLTLRPAFAAGHSMGQYSALVAAGALSFADGLRLVRERGRQMQASGEGRPGAMAALIGLDDGRLPELVERASAFGVFSVANRNAPGQVVVSGGRPAVEASLEIARALGARKSILLPISIGAHSALMADAALAMAVVLSTVRFADPDPPLLANATAAIIRDAGAARRELVEHLTAGVDWVAAVEAMAAAGVDTFVEVGPGRVLSGLIRRIAPHAHVLPLDDPSAAGGLSAAAVEAVLAASAGAARIAPAFAPAEEVSRA